VCVCVECGEDRHFVACRTALHCVYSWLTAEYKAKDAIYDIYYLYIYCDC